MREIKFRAWDDDVQCFTYSDQEDDNYVWGFKDGQLKAWAIIDIPATRDEPMHPESVELEKPEEYTGLHDSQGREIFEGDKFTFIAGYYKANRNKQLTDIVVFRDGAFVGDKTLGVLTSYDQLEIIGNIYETPELLNAVKPEKSLQKIHSNNKKSLQ